MPLECFGVHSVIGVPYLRNAIPRHAMRQPWSPDRPSVRSAPARQRRTRAATETAAEPPRFVGFFGG